MKSLYLLVLVFLSGCYDSDRVRTCLAGADFAIQTLNSAGYKLPEGSDAESISQEIFQKCRGYND